MSDLKQLRGLKDLVRDAMQHGTTAVEKVHLETARRPFSVLESIAGLSEPVKGIHQVHDAVVATTYGAVRAVAQAVDKALEGALDALDDQTAPAASDADPQPPAQP
jgi:hypothetical protein